MLDRRVVAKKKKPAPKATPASPAKRAVTSSVGKLKVPRKDGMPKVDGHAKYVDDLAFPAMLHAAVATSAEPHAWLDAVDIDAAVAAPGVVAVLTAADVPGKNQIGVVKKDQPLLAQTKVRWLGDRLAIVAAETPRQARAAAALVRATYRKLRPVFDVEEALLPTAPVLHDDNPTGNLAGKGCIYKGKAKDPLQGADVVVETTYEFGMQEHAYLETQGVLAVPEADGCFTVYASMQCPFYVQAGVADVLGLPLAKVRVVQTTTGGAFGGKEDYPTEPACCAAMLAQKTGRPVKLIMNRGEDIKYSTKREAQRVRHRLGAKKDGTFTGFDIDIFVDAGAYAGLAPVVSERGNASVVGPYKVPQVRVDTHTVYTCNAFSGAFRGFGHPQVAVATEMQIDELARRLNMSPVDIRRKNLLRPGDISPTGVKMPAPLEALETLEAAVQLVDYDALMVKVRRHNATNGRTRLGVGVSTIAYGCLLHAGGQYLEGAGALVQVHKDGSVSVSVGNTEMGQGSQTVLAQIAADALLCPYESVNVKTVDTDLVPDSGPTVASRTTTMSGNATLDACRQLRVELDAAKKTMPKAKSAPSFADVAMHAFREKRHLLKAGWYAPPRKQWDAKTGQGDAYSAYAYATMIAVVEVDTLTGRTRVKKVAAAHDVGRAIFVDGVAGQIEGGVAQGMGYAIMERLVQREGKILNANFTDYLIPSSLDAPPVDIVLLESRGVGKGQAAGPDGAKGVGEPSLIPICAAVGNAIACAVGAPIPQMPFMPELVLHALAGNGFDPLDVLPAA